MTKITMDTVYQWLGMSKKEIERRYAGWSYVAIQQDIEWLLYDEDAAAAAALAAVIYQHINS